MFCHSGNSVLFDLLLEYVLLMSNSRHMFVRVMTEMRHGRFGVASVSDRQVVQKQIEEKLMVELKAVKECSTSLIFITM